MEKLPDGHCLAWRVLFFDGSEAFVSQQQPKQLTHGLPTASSHKKGEMRRMLALALLWTNFVQNLTQIRLTEI